MENVPSRSLSDLIRDEGPLPAERVAAIGAQVADGLASAHAAGITHRDVKPGNVLVREDGVAKISDFGIARTAGDPALTQSGLFIGTPTYFSPELARGAEPDPVRGRVGARRDALRRGRGAAALRAEDQRGGGDQRDRQPAAAAAEAGRRARAGAAPDARQRPAVAVVDGRRGARPAPARRPALRAHPRDHHRGVRGRRRRSRRQPTRPGRHDSGPAGHLRDATTRPATAPAPSARRRRRPRRRPPAAPVPDRTAAGTAPACLLAAVALLLVGGVAFAALDPGRRPDDLPGGHGLAEGRRHDVDEAVTEPDRPARSRRPAPRPAPRRAAARRQRGRRHRLRARLLRHRPRRPRRGLEHALAPHAGRGRPRLLRRLLEHGVVRAGQQPLAGRRHRRRDAALHDGRRPGRDRAAPDRPGPPATAAT